MPGEIFSKINRKDACGKAVNLLWSLCMLFVQFSLATCVAIRQNPGSLLP
jgi:hypothetical protein